MRVEWQTQGHRPAFSLLESIVVLAVIALITAVVAPSLVQRSFGSPEQQTVRAVRDSLTAARLEAVRSATPVSAEIRLENADLALQWGGNSSRWSGVRLSVASIDGEAISAFAVRFDARGRADQRGLRFLDESAGTMWEIAFDGVTGRPLLRNLEDVAE